jgi:streptogramin lyase
MLLAALQVCAQAQSVMTPAQREAGVRLKLSPETILRGDARGEHWAALDVENLLTVYSQRSGEVLWKTRIGEAGPPRDFAADGEGVVYWLGTGGQSISKWRPLAAGPEFSMSLSLDGDPASAIAVDPEGSRMFVAAAGRIWILDGKDGSVILRGSAELESTVVQLRFDPDGQVLVAEGAGFTATLPLTLDRADVFRSTQAATFSKLPAASNSNNRAAIYPVVFPRCGKTPTVVLMP